MSDWDEFDDEDGQGTDLLKDLRKQLKEKTAREKELAEKLTGLETQVRQRTVGDVLKAQGVPSEVADLVPKDVEPNEEAVGKWLEGYRHLFGKTEEKPAEGEEAHTQTSGESTVSAEVQEAMQRTAATGASGLAPASKAQEQIEAIKKASPEELLEMITAAQQARAA